MQSNVSGCKGLMNSSTYFHTHCMSKTSVAVSRTYLLIERYISSKISRTSIHAVIFNTIYNRLIFIHTYVDFPNREITLSSRFILPFSWNCRYTGRPRAGTALELLRVVKEIETRASEVTAPLLICHGEEDIVCDPDGSRMLYKNAGSTDKTLHVYPGMWHQLVGEPDEGVALVFGHITSWLESHLPNQT